MVDHIQKTKDMIAVMQAFVDGKEIQFRNDDGTWMRTSIPLWDWGDHPYRIKPDEPDYINWDHVHPDFNYMARNPYGKAHLYSHRPYITNSQQNYWNVVLSCKVERAYVFSSYKQGDTSWPNSIVVRPGVEEDEKNTI